MMSPSLFASQAPPKPVPGAPPTIAKPPPRPGTTGDAEARKQLFGAFNKVGKAPKELEGDPNGDVNGDSATQEGERYWGLLNAQVHKYYDVSQTIPESERIHLKAVVLIRIGSSGALLSETLARSSKNNLFDQAVVLAIKKAAPFSPPPDNLRAALESSGVALEFTP